MNCPKCSYPNAVGATHCNMCHEVFNRSAADRYLHAQKRARMLENGSAPRPVPKEVDTRPNAPFMPFLHVRNFLAQVNWESLWKHSAWTVIDFVQTRRKELALAAGLVTLGTLALYLSSPEQRLSIFGSRLSYLFSTRKPATYFVGIHTEYKSWSERSDRLDTPLDNSQRDELGNITATATAFQKKIQKIIFKPSTWIVNQSGDISQNIPLSHPSLKPCVIFINRKGVLLKRVLSSPARLGRVTLFMTPQWPSDTQRTGSRWDEPVQWVQALGDWKILWKGTLHWKVVGAESWDAVNCLHLRYTAEVEPKLWQSPDWARGGVHSVSYRGTASGDACFDKNQRQIFSNDYLQDGMLSVPIDNIYRIPPELRVGRTPRRHWGQNVPAERGTIRFQIKDRLGIHKS